MSEPLDLSKLRAQRGQEAPAPGQRTPITVQLIGTPGGPWALMDADGSMPIAHGIGDDTRASILALASLAALAFRVATPEAIQEAIGQAQATVAAQLAGWADLQRLAALGRDSEAQAAAQAPGPGHSTP